MNFSGAAAIWTRRKLAAVHGEGTFPGSFALLAVRERRNEFTATPEAHDHKSAIMPEMRCVRTIQFPIRPGIMEEVALPLHIIVTNRRDDHIGIATFRENALSESVSDNRTAGAAGFPETANKSRLGRPGQAGSLFLGITHFLSSV